MWGSDQASPLCPLSLTCGAPPRHFACSSATSGGFVIASHNTRSNVANSPKQPRNNVKDIAGLAAVLLGLGLLWEAIQQAGAFGLAFIIASVTWLLIHARERDTARTERAREVHRLFGVTEHELTAMFGLNGAAISYLISDATARAEWSDRLAVRLRTLPPE